MKQGRLLNECIHFKKKFLVYLRQGLESLNPDIYESSVQILAEMIDKGHVIQLMGKKLIIRSLEKKSRF
jgi:hypothetical protein